MGNDESSKKQASRTAGEAGWHVSRYNISAPVPEKNAIVIANLLKGNCAAYSSLEMYLLSVLEELDENHPIIERFAKRGIIANYDERAAVETMGRAACGIGKIVGLTICPTMGCNFDCPYCFEDHGRGKMSPEVQDDIIALTERMFDASGAKGLEVTWFGGEPLLYPDVIESLTERLIAVAEEHGAGYNATIVTNGYLMDQATVDLLDRCKVRSAQVTIDGLGPTHDATRRLAGGGGSFERITSNLRDSKIPFRVNIRNNVHEGNKGEMEELKAFIGQLAEESGNDLHYYPAPVAGSAVADERGEQVGLLCSDDASLVGIMQESGRFGKGRGCYCGASRLWCVGIDDRGNLQKCWEAVDKPELAFGTARDWDPENPLETASNVDNLTKFLNVSMPIDDEECLDCVWLPACAGGCPHKRLYERRRCIAFKDDPEGYVLALYERLKKQVAEKADAEAEAE